MFELFTKGKRKPFVISKEFVKEILKSKTKEENNLGRQKVKKDRY